MVYPKKACDFQQEGVVVIEFTVEPDATLSNFKVVNTVSFELDNAVINCLKRTNGMWIPGQVNGNPSPMEKKVYVLFDLEETPTLTEQAQLLYLRGIRAYHKGCQNQETMTVGRQISETKEMRLFRRSLKFLNLAQKYCHDDPSILFWQASNYKKLGNIPMLNKKMEEILEIINSNLAVNQLREDENVAQIVVLREPKH